jgi:hypothetical protein
MFLRSLIALLALLVAPRALAWNDSGHMQIALIAYDRLPPDTQKALGELLRKHPRFAEDFAARKPRAVIGAAIEQRWYFAQAATWPDRARDQSLYDRPTWHYINQPLFLSDEDRWHFRSAGIPGNVSHSFAPGASTESFNAAQALAFVRGKLSATATPPRDRALFVTWLMHLVGDVHQPLHAVAMYSKRRFRTGDRGGNEVLLTGQRSLHAVWDGFLGSGVTLGYVSRRAADYVADPKLRSLGEAAARELDTDVWLDESVELAETVVYDATVLAAIDQVERGPSPLKPLAHPAQSYYVEGRAHSRRRAVEAGFRLAALLATIRL